MHQMITRRASETNPMRSMPTFIPAHRIFGWTPLQQARSLLDQAERHLPMARTTLQLANAELGQANGFWRKDQRRRLQGAAMRVINGARAALLAAHCKLDAARAEVERLENQPELPFPPPVAQQPARAVDTLHHPRGNFPAGTSITIERSPNGGVYVSIVRPGRGGIATHVPDMDDARRWVNVQFAAPTLH